MRHKQQNGALQLSRWVWCMWASYMYRNSILGELAWTTDKWFWVNSNIILYKAVSYATKELKNNGVLKFKTLYTLICGL